MKLRAREAAATVILEAAEEVAATRGLEATSTAAIAERAGVAVGTLYNYFVDRDALLTALFKLRRDELLPRIVAAAESAKPLPFEQRLRAYMAGVARAFEDFRRFCRVAMSTEASTKIRGQKSVVLETVTQALTEILRPVVRAHAEEYARMMFGAFKGVLQWRIERDEPLEPGAAQIVDVFLKGLA
jgi:AcrR family transcriptional regulator